jgi:hypothetical protein
VKDRRVDKGRVGEGGYRRKKHIRIDGDLIYGRHWVLFHGSFLFYKHWVKESREKFGSEQEKQGEA